MNKIKKKIKKLSRESLATIIALFFVFSIGVFLRIEGILTNSYAFTYDVGRDLLKVQEIVINGDIPLIGQTTGLGGLFYGPWWYYILTPSFVLSQGNPQGVVFFMMIVGIGAVLASYFLGKLLWGRMLGIILAAIMGFSPVMIGYSNQIWNPNIAPFFVLCIFILLEKLFLAKRKFLLYIMLGLLLGLTIDSEILFGILFATGIMIGLLIQYRKKLFNLSFFGVFIGLFITFLPRILFEFRHGFIMSKTIITPKENGEGLISLSTFLPEIPNRLITILNQFSETVSLNNFIMGVCVAFLILLIIILSFKKIPDACKRLLLFEVIIIFVFIFGTSIFDRAIWGHYIVALPVLYILFVGIALQSLFKKNMLVGIVVLVLYLLFLLKPLDIIKNIQAPLWEGNAAVYRNQTAVLDYIYKDANGRKFNYIVYTPAVHDYPYQYLFSWYGIKQYGYIPSKEAKDLFYVIIEPDPGYEGRVKDWLKIRQNDGKVVKEKVIKGGIKVQQRAR